MLDRLQGGHTLGGIIVKEGLDEVKGVCVVWVLEHLDLVL